MLVDVQFRRSPYALLGSPTILFEANYPCGRRFDWVLPRLPTSAWNSILAHGAIHQWLEADEAMSAPTNPEDEPEIPKHAVGMTKTTKWQRASRNRLRRKQANVSKRKNR